MGKNGFLDALKNGLAALAVALPLSMSGCAEPVPRAYPVPYPIYNGVVYSYQSDTYVPSYSAYSNNVCVPSYSYSYSYSSPFLGLFPNIFYSPGVVFLPNGHEFRHEERRGGGILGESHGRIISPPTRFSLPQHFAPAPQAHSFDKPAPSLPFRGSVRSSPHSSPHSSPNFNKR